MNKMTIDVNRPAPNPRASRFDRISIFLHWITAVLVMTQLATAWLLSEGDGDAPLLLIIHRSIGIVTWIVVIARLAWRRTFAYLPPFPASMPKINQQAAKLNEYGLYALLVIEPLAGICNALFRGKPFTLFVWQVPAILNPDKDYSHMFQSIHEWCGWALVVLIGLHAAAGLFHGLVLRDGIFQRMMPWRDAPPRARDRLIFETDMPVVVFVPIVEPVENESVSDPDHPCVDQNQILSRL